MALVQEKVDCCDRCGERDGVKNYWTSQELFVGDLCKACAKQGRMLLDAWVGAGRDEVDPSFIAGQQHALMKIGERAAELLGLPTLTAPPEMLGADL